MNPKMNHDWKTSARLEQASQWWLKLNEVDVSPDELSRWFGWCKADPSNLYAFEKIVALGSCFDYVDAETRVDLVREFMSDAQDRHPSPRRASPAHAAPML